MTPIQAPTWTENRRKSETENARTLAKAQAWSFDENDRVLDEDGLLVGYTIEDVAVDEALRRTTRPKKEAAAS